METEQVYALTKAVGSGSRELVEVLELVASSMMPAATTRKKVEKPAFWLRGRYKCRALAIAYRLHTDWKQGDSASITLSEGEEIQNKK